MRAAPKTIEIIIHYCKDDPEYCGDYSSMELLIDGDIIAEYADAYHDHSQDKISGWIDCLQWVYGTNHMPKIKRTNIADSEY